MTNRWNPIFCFLASLVFTTISTAAEPAPWPEWRGPHRDSQAGALTLPASISEAENKKLWSVPLDPGYSGPVIANGLVFVASTESQEDEVVQAYEVQTGKKVWETRWKGAMSVFFIAKSNGDWIRATPTYHEGKLYVAGMQDLLVCLNAADGKILWKCNLAEKFETGDPAFGFVCSPLVKEKSVYVQAANGICRVDAETGEVLWRVLVNEEAYGSAFSSPVLADLHGQTQLVVQTRKELAGIDLDSGEVFWTVPVPAFRNTNVLTPLLVGSQQIFTSSYGGGSHLFEVLKDEAGSWSVETVWTSKLQGYMSSPVLIDNAIYLHMRNQRLACIDAASGEELWTTTPYGKYWSMIAGKNRLLALDAKGDLLLIEPSREQFQLLGEMHVTDATSWAHLAVDDKRIYVRALDELQVYQK